MFRISAFRILTLLVLLSSSGAAAAEAAPRPAPTGARSLASSLWHFFAAFLPGAAVSATDEGCGIDPFGRCDNQPGADAAIADGGCTIDPFGLCKK